MDRIEHMKRQLETLREKIDDSPTDVVDALVEDYRDTFDNISSELEDISNEQAEE